jgi:hypothetical protein
MTIKRSNHHQTFKINQKKNFGKLGKYSFDTNT